MIGPSEVAFGLQSLKDVVVAPSDCSGLLADLWNPEEIHELIAGMALYFDHDQGSECIANGSTRDIKITPGAFRARLMSTLGDDDDEIDRDLAASRAVLPLYSRLEVRTDGTLKVIALTRSP